MSDQIDSPVLGRTRMPTDAEVIEINRLLDATVLGVFQELNKRLNQRGLCVMITVRDGVNATTFPRGSA